MRLVEQGKLSLDTKAVDILDPWLKKNFHSYFAPLGLTFFKMPSLVGNLSF